MALWTLDSGYHLDEQDDANMEIEVEFGVDVTYIERPLADTNLEMIVKLDTDIEVLQAVDLDLYQYIPQKFKIDQDPNNALLKDFINVAEIFVGSWISDIRDIINLANPYLLSSTTYMRHLGALIGAKFPPEDDTTAAEIQRILLQAVDWYKVKGTYQSIQILANIHKFTINIYDMYTNDYSSFYLTDWFVGDEDENPTGLDSTYYKSPHFTIEIVLNKVYSVSPAHLWEADYLDNLLDRVEDTRPIHTVPHYMLLLNPQADEFGNTVEVDGQIKAKVLTGWQVSTKYFDETDSTEAWNFDDGTYFDQSAEAFINSVTTWKLGTGGCYYFDSGYIFESGWDLETPILTGSIDPDDITITDEKITYEFIVPKSTVQANISELSLVTNTGQTVFVSCFPKIDLDSRTSLRCVCEIYKSDLS